MLTLTEPTLLLDKQKCIRNIQRMVEKAKKNNVVFRPHFKTHQSHEVGRWFRNEGVTRITVSSLTMAEYFAQDGWKDITVAIPVNVHEKERINRLASTITLNLLVVGIVDWDHAPLETGFQMGPVWIWYSICCGEEVGSRRWDESRRWRTDDCGRGCKCHRIGITGCSLAVINHTAPCAYKNECKQRVEYS